MSRRREPVIPDAILDQLLVGADAETAFDPNGLIDQLKKALADRALELSIPRDRQGSFDPQLIGKYQRRLPRSWNRLLRLLANRGQENICLCQILQ
jgi:putative transposase